MFGIPPVVAEDVFKFGSKLFKVNVVAELVDSELLFGNFFFVFDGAE